MSINIAGVIPELAKPETSERKYPLSEWEIKHLNDVVRACENSTFTFINGITAIGNIMEQVGLHEEVFRELDALTFSQVGSLISELSLMIDLMADTKSEAKYIRDYKPEEVQS